MGKHLQVGFASSLTVIFKCTKVEVASYCIIMHSAVLIINY